MDTFRRTTLLLIHSSDAIHVILKIPDLVFCALMCPFLFLGPAVIEICTFIVCVLLSTISDKYITSWGYLYLLIFIFIFQFCFSYISILLTINSMSILNQRCKQSEAEMTLSHLGQKQGCAYRDALMPVEKPAVFLLAATVNPGTESNQASLQGAALRVNAG